MLGCQADVPGRQVMLRKLALEDHEIAPLLKP